MLQFGPIVCAITRHCSPPPLPENGVIFLKLRSGRLHWKRAVKKSAEK
ncbi:MAG: hypothetical protein ACK56F_27300 [bacterium]